MLSINTNSAYTYGCQTAAYRRQNIQKTFAENVNQQLTPPSVIHIGELGFGADNLGRQYALNYAEDSTDENPIVIAKGNDEYGQQFEERIYINDIDLNNASYLEMAALAAHTKQIAVFQRHFLQDIMIISKRKIMWMTSISVSPICIKRGLMMPLYMRQAY